MYDDLVQLAEASARQFADRPLFGQRREGSWHWRSYAEVFRQVDELRAGLAALGVQPGERIAIVSRNSPEWAIAAYATYGLGATFVPMYEAQLPDEWEFILRDCGATVVLGRTADIVATLDAMQPNLHGLRQVIAIEGADTDPRSLRALRARGRAHPVPAHHPDPDSVAGFVYTSGTTGRPKGAMLSHRNLTSNVAASTEVFPIGPEDRTVAFLPWAHVYGQVAELHILISVGASTAFNDDIARLVEDLGEVRPTMLFAVPRVFNRIHAGVVAQIAARPRPLQRLFEAGLAASLRRRRGATLSPRERATRWLADRLVFAKIRAKFGGRLKYAMSASATLSKEVGEFIDGIGIEVYEGYGLTETSPVVTANTPGRRKLGSCGRPIPGVTVRIDESLGDAPGEGEIVVYGPNVMKGYHARPEENARAFGPDGGLRTGDLGYLDEDGYLFISGRIKEQFKLANGKYVMPTPLEEQLALSPYIANVMLEGTDRPYPVAVIVIDAHQIRAWADEHGVTLGDDLTQDPAVHELLARELAQRGAGFRSYERPQRFVVTTEDFTIDNGELTPTFKLKRRNVVGHYRDALEALYREPASPRPPAPAPAHDELRAR